MPWDRELSQITDLLTGNNISLLCEWKWKQFVTPPSQKQKQKKDRCECEGGGVEEKGCSIENGWSPEVEEMIDNDVYIISYFPHSLSGKSMNKFR